MRERTLQAMVGIIFILSQFGMIAMVAAFYIIRGFTFEETTTTIAIIVPLFAGYTLIIVRAIVAERNKPATSLARVSGLFAFLSLFASIAFVAALMALIYLRAYNIGLSSFEQFKTILSSLEGVFALYLAPVVQSLFSAGAPEQQPGTIAAPGAGAATP